MAFYSYVSNQILFNNIVHYFKGVYTMTEEYNIRKLEGGDDPLWMLINPGSRTKNGNWFYF